MLTMGFADDVERILSETPITSRSPCFRDHAPRSANSAPSICIDRSKSLVGENRCGGNISQSCAADDPRFSGTEDGRAHQSARSQPFER